MTVSFTRAASRELVEAAAYYNGVKAGLGYEFVAEVRATVATIREFPEAWQRCTPRLRRSATRRFPYGVIYRLTTTEVQVVGIVHNSRDPRHWRER